MEIEELDVHLDELEVRLERLRALYEQYFLGIEKIEPTIARKDVDRRIYLLRREKIRNTGRRFKLQTLIQRYNTFQQYWQRICREIENGTYRRHVARAEKVMGPSELLTVAARRRFGKSRDAAPTDEAAPSNPEAAAAVAQVEAAPISVRRSSVPARGSVPPGPSRPRTSHPPRERPSRVPPSMPAAPTPRMETPTLPRGTRIPQLPELRSAPASLGSDLDSAFPPPPASAPRAGPPRPSAERRVESLPRSASPTHRPAKSIPPRPYESLELDMDFMADWDPSEPARPQASSGEKQKPRGKPAPPSATSPTTPQAVAAPPTAEAASTGARKAPPPKPMRATRPQETRVVDVHAPEGRRPERDTHPGLAPPPAGTPGPPAARAPTAPSAPKPVAPREPASTAPRPPSAPTVSTEARPVAPGPSVTSTVQPNAASADKPTATPAAAARARPAAARRPAATPARADQKPAETSSLTEDRLRTLHTRLSEANQKANQPVPSFEGLTRSLRAAEAKLRTQHGNRRIEFEVVLKDGKPIVKPVVR